MNNHNLLSNQKYLISAELEEYMLNGAKNKAVECSNKSRPEGLYIIAFKKLNNNNKVIYNYLYYDKLFIDCMLIYIYTRQNYNNITRGYINTKSILLDDSIIFNNIDININDKSGFGYNEIDMNYLSNRIIELAKEKSLMKIYESIFLLNHRTSLSNISQIIYLDCKNKYFDIMNLLYKDILNLSEYKEELFNNESLYECVDTSNNVCNPIDNMIVVSKNLDLLIKNLSEKGIDLVNTINSNRGEVSNLSNFLSMYDMDFRNTLYYHHRYHRDNNNYILKTVLSRSKFSFKNIHMNLGTVRYYSTSNKYNSRQNLFKDSYVNIKDIIENNRNKSFYDMQILIEKFLYNQEEKYNLTVDNNNNNIKFNSETYDFLNNNYNNIIKLISKESFLSVKNLKDRSKTIIPEIVNTLGDKNISKLLISYFLEILTKESTSIDNYESPGLMSQHVYINFGSKLINRYIFKLYINSGKKYESLSIFKNSDEYKEEFDLYDDLFKFKVGGEFIGALIELNLIYEDSDSKPDNIKEIIKYIRISSQTKSKLSNNINKFLHIPQKLPMICEPKNYYYSENLKENKLGGYLLNDVYYTNQIFKNKRGYEETTKLTRDNIIVSLINGLSKIPYKINLDTLNYINEYGLKKDILIKYDKKKMNKFIIDSYNSFNKKERLELRKLYSQITLEKDILDIAQTYSSADNIYFPVRLDNRTRIYCETDFFDYQKIDLAKGLILFSKPGYITRTDDLVIKYYKSYGANMYGNGLDKKSMNTRVKWIDDNIEKILNFRNNNIIKEAENKTCFLSFCFEFEKFREFYNDPEKVCFPTYLPIQLDASCNGYQHLALLTKETKLFNKLNLAESNHIDNPDDFYSYIIDKTNDYIKNEIELLKNKIELLIDVKDKNDKEIKEIKRYNSLLRLGKISFDRSIVKKTIMTKSYNASIPRQVANIADNLIEKIDNITKEEYYISKKNSDIKIYREDLLTFVMCLKNVLDIESPKIKELSKYLDQIVKICTELNMPIPWNLPTGAMIKESYQIEKEFPIQPFSFIKSKYIFKKYIKGSINLRKTKRATMPNLIHSLDASTIALLYKEFSSVGNIYTVHDCFATTADNVPILISILKSVYLKLYSSEDYLKQFDILVKTMINKQFGNKIFDLNTNIVYIPKGNKIKPMIYPCIDNVINIKEFEIKKLMNLTKSSYTLI